MDWVFDTDGKPITPVTIVTHQTINGKYRIQFERVGSANKTDGVKVEVNGDSLEEVLTEARTSYEWAINHLIPLTSPASPPLNSKPTLIISPLSPPNPMSSEGK